MISVQALRKSFGSLAAVAGVDFEVAAGETFGLLGPNGAGKTTTISLLTGLLPPDTGSITIADRRDPTRPEVRRILGVAPQSLSIYEQFTPHENLTFFARLYGLTSSQVRSRVDWALEFAGLTDRRHDRVKGFSGGMKRRLNLACALVHDPQVILLDEPTVGVDPQSRNHMFESIEQLRREGRTILYTTHYMEEARRLCDRVAIMDHGRILALDTVDALLARYGGDSVIRGELDRPPPAGVVPAGALDGLRLRWESTAPLDEINRLAAAGVGFRSLEITRSDLESVFLHLTGRSLRDG
jgi:ABC-2 type transport system ATP-binding protein